MAELKTKLTEASVDEFINKLDESQREDIKTISTMMKVATKSEPKMWGTAIIGFGFEHLKYESGRELDWFKIGFSPRKQNLTLYILKGSAQKYLDLLAKLGKYTTSKGCLYIKKLSDVNQEVLKEIIDRSLTA